MAIDFPNSPAPGDNYTVGTKTWTFTDGKWALNVNSLGVTGATGPTGPAGVTGPQGVSGTPSSVPGPSGPSGPQGVSGVPGSNGTNGAVGATGPQGIQGVAGPSGPSGPQGAQGVAGPSGPQGAQGTAGTNGAAGAQGAQGNTGAAGGTGAQGPQGPQGAQGATGGFNSGSNNTIDLWASQGTNGTYSEPLSIKAWEYSGQNKISCRNSSNNLVAYIGDTGRVAGTGTFLNLSDRNSKENIVYVDKSILSAAVDSLKPATFNYIGGEEQHLGFIAQDVQEVLPDAVKAFDENRLALDTNVIIAALVAKCQDLETRLTQLENP